LYNIKYVSAEKSGVDLSSLPALIQDMRQQKSVAKQVEVERREEAVRHETFFPTGLSNKPFVKSPSGTRFRFSADGQRFLAGSEGYLEVFDTQTEALVATFKNSEGHGFIYPKLNADGSKMIAGIYDPKSKATGVQIWDVQTGKRS
jgi:WD40 repeat protein